MMTEPKLLSECGTKLVLDDSKEDHYEIEIEPGEYIVVRAGSTVGHAGFRFSNNSVAKVSNQIFEFKHYRSNGSKFWTARAGRNFYFVIPRSEVKILPQKGYSYIPAEINGVKVVFNVGGGGGHGWTDWLHTTVSISVNHPVRDLKKLAAVAVRGTNLEPIAVEEMTPDQVDRWNKMAARATKGVRECIFRLIEEGKKPIVKLVPGYTVSECIGLELSRRYKKVPTEVPGHFSVEPVGSVKAVISSAEGYFGGVRTKLSQIDWDATCRANGLEPCHVHAA